MTKSKSFSLLSLIPDPKEFSRDSWSKRKTRMVVSRSGNLRGGRAREAAQRTGWE